jgi:hypothetical protein
LQTDTPKALANFSPGLELATTLGIKYQNNDPTLKGLKPRENLNAEKPFQG